MCRGGATSSGQRRVLGQEGSFIFIYFYFSLPLSFSVGFFSSAGNLNGIIHIVQGFCGHHLAYSKVRRALLSQIKPIRLRMAACEYCLVFTSQSASLFPPNQKCVSCSGSFALEYFNF